MSAAVCRSQPASEDIKQIFDGKLTNDTLVVCDGTKSYNTLAHSGVCDVIHTDENVEGFKNINSVNGYHSFIKERNRDARGFATKYLNRYNALFSLVYNTNEFIVDDIYKLLFDRKSRYNTIALSQSHNLFMV